MVAEAALGPQFVWSQFSRTVGVNATQELFSQSHAIEGWDNLDIFTGFEFHIGQILV
jgi:hypothetical protein